ncbi:MAG: hypothetical protein QM228_02980 [Atribacterota bacterium]|nr:hypothetical protein [Atribacterota bacterium]
MDTKKREKLFAWLTEHGVQIDPQFEEKLKEMQKAKELAEFEQTLPQTTGQVEGYKEVAVNVKESIQNWLIEVAKEQEPPEDDWKFWIDTSGVLHKRGE